VASSVLDSSAVLAFVNGEPGAEIVARLIGDSLISTVNFAEVVTKLVERSGSLELAREALAIVDLDLIDFDRDLAENAGGLIARTKLKGLSLGDRACLALAVRERLPAVTGDRGWESLDVGVEVRLFR
jgi:ribonuclease VapC